MQLVVRGLTSFSIRILALTALVSWPLASPAAARPGSSHSDAAASVRVSSEAREAPDGAASPSAVPAARGQQGEAAPGENQEEPESAPAAQEPSSGPAGLRLQERVTVTASRLEQPLLQSGSSVTVLDAADIAATGARWLHEVLDTVPGVSAVQTAGPGSVSSVFLRGGNSNHTLVMIDGVEVNSPTTGGYDFGFLPAERIERVEVLRGPQSTLYGSEALAGVIQVFTRRGDGTTSLGLGAEVGAHSTGTGSVWASGAAGDWRWSAGLSYLETAGISAAAADRGASEPDGLDEITFDGSVAWRPSEGLGVEAFVRGFDASADLDGFEFGFGPADDENFVLATREIHAGTRLDAERGIWRGELAVTMSKQDADSDDPDGAFFTGSAIDAWTGEVDLQNEVDLGDRHTLVAGVEARREAARAVSRSPFGDSAFDESTRTLALYVEDRIDLGDRVQLSVGGRHDDHDRFGGATTFRVAASTRLDGTFRFHASAGSGFRAPSLNDLFFPGFGNPALEAEESVGWDAGLEAYWRHRDLRVDVTWFAHEIDRLIQFSPALRRAENIGEARARGLETAVQWAPLARLRLDGSYTWTEAEEADTGLQLVRRPRHQASLAATLWPSGGLRLHARLLAKGARVDAGPTGRVELAPYARVDMAGSYRLGSELEITGRIENLLDADYAEVFGFGVPGRSAYVALGWHWGG